MSDAPASTRDFSIQNSLSSSLPLGHTHVKLTARDSPCTDTSALPESLDSLLSDCFQHSLDPCILPASRTEHVHKFHKYLHDVHCHENLDFIIEIYRYEYFYNKMVPAESATHKLDGLSSSYLNQSFEQVIKNLPHPTTAMGKHCKKNTVKSLSNASLTSTSGVPFDLEFDELPVDHQDAWNQFSNQVLDCPTTASESDLSTELKDESDESAQESTDLEKLLENQWNFVIATFIMDKAPQEINLSNKTYRAIMDNAKSESRLHSPLVLMDARTEVRRLLYENAYFPFIKSLKNCHRDVCTPACTATFADSPQNIANPLTGSSCCRSGSKCTSPSSTSSRLDIPGSAHSAPSKPIAAAPVPKKKMFFKSLSGSSSSDVPSSPNNAFSSMLTHLKPQPSNGGLSRSFNSAPQSPIASLVPPRGLSPSINSGSSEDPIPRSRSTVVPYGHNSPSMFTKFWKKRKGTNASSASES